MAELGTVASQLIEFYQIFINAMPPFVGDFFKILLLVLIIVVYSIFIWKFYRFIATKNLMGLDLKRYNRFEHRFLAKFFAVLFYFAEYIIILPFIIFFWFGIFTLFLIFLTENLSVDTVLLISATVIASIRMTAYYNEDLSKDVAKMLPFMLLAASILTPGFFNIEKIISQVSTIPSFFSKITFYLLVIIVLEIVLRFFDFMISLFGLEDVEIKTGEQI